MKLGFFSAIVPDLSFEQVIDFAADNRFQCVEVGCWPTSRADRRFAGVCHIDVSDFTRARADDLRALCVARSIGISALGYYPNPLDPDAAISGPAVEHLKKLIVASEMLGVGQINTFIGRDPYRTIEENWPAFLNTWKPLIALADEHGVKVAIENCPMMFGRDEWPGGKNLATSPAIWRRMFEDIPSENFGLNFDPSHFVMQQMDPISGLREFKDRLFHFHAKDVAIHRERLNDVGIFAFPKEWHTPRIPGFGEIDWARFFAALYEIGYDGPVCIEVEDDTFGKTLEGRQRALKVARNVLRPFFE